MEALIRELLPHAPNLGLYLAPDIPPRMLERAVSDYGSTFETRDVLALYDATRLGSGGDGALFGSDRFAFQNSNLQRGQIIRYTDVVGVRSRRRLLGGRYVEIDVNRGRATVPVRLDFAARPEAARYVARLLNEAMLHEPGRTGGTDTDWPRVEAALEQLVRDGRLSELDRQRMLNMARGEA